MSELVRMPGQQRASSTREMPPSATSSAKDFETEIRLLEAGRLAPVDHHGCVRASATKCNHSDVLHDDMGSLIIPDRITSIPRSSSKVWPSSS